MANADKRRVVPLALRVVSRMARSERLTKLESRFAPPPPPRHLLEVRTELLCSGVPLLLTGIAIAGVGAILEPFPTHAGAVAGLVGLAVGWLVVVALGDRFELGRVKRGVAAATAPPADAPAASHRASIRLGLSASGAMALTFALVTLLLALALLHGHHPDREAVSVTIVGAGLFAGSFGAVFLHGAWWVSRCERRRGVRFLRRPISQFGPFIVVSASAT